MRIALATARTQCCVFMASCGTVRRKLSVTFETKRRGAVAGTFVSYSGGPEFKLSCEAD